MKPCNYYHQNKHPHSSGIPKGYTLVLSYCYLNIYVTWKLNNSYIASAVFVFLDIWNTSD